MKKIFLLCALCASTLMVHAAFSLAGYYVDGSEDVADISAGIITVGKATVTGAISYQAATKTLTLNNAHVTYTTSGSMFLIYPHTELTIQLIGDNELISNNEEEYINGLEMRGSGEQVTITGGGSLTIESYKWYPVCLGAGVLTVSNTTVDFHSTTNNYGIGYNSGIGGQLVIGNANLTTPDVSSLSAITLTNCDIIQPAGAEVANNEGAWKIDKHGSSGNIIIQANLPSDVTNISIPNKANKHIVNGQLVIEKNGKLYNALGAEMK